MSLRVWLPLTGDLRNNGLSDVTVTNNGATVDNSGKIGKCYYFNGSSSYMWSSDYANLGDTFSICAWVNLKSNGRNNGLFCTRNATYGGFTIFFNAGILTIDPCASSYSASTRWATNFTASTNTWYHIVITRTPTTVSAYVNGQFLQSKDVAFSSSYGNCFTIGSYNTNGSGIGTLYYGYINDFRIYDHALSPKEVKLLSQGLVCHYKLSDPYIEGTTNMCNVQYLPSSRATTWSGHTYARTLISCIDAPIPIDACDQIDITYSGSGGGGVGYAIQQNIPVSASTIYTYSCYIKSSVGYATRSVANLLYRYELDSSGTRVKEGGVFNASQMIPLGDGWYRCWGTFTTQSSAAKINLYFYAYPDQNAQYCITCWQLEQKDHMTPYVLGTRNETQVIDSSGYNHHGVNYSSQVLPNAPRNSNATFFDGSSQYIEFTNLDFMPNMLPDEWSFSFWVYNQDSGDRSIIFSNYQLGTAGINGFCFEKAGNNNLRVGYVGGKFDRTIPNSTMTVDAWTHYVVTKTKAHLVTVYRNGVQIDSYTNTNCASEGVIYRMGRDVRSDSTMYHGGLADFRAYATVLTAEDTQQLYNTPVSVANTGAMMTQGEFVEVVT